jgi:hypothetical protein
MSTTADATSLKDQFLEATKQGFLVRMWMTKQDSSFPTRTIHILILKTFTANDPAATDLGGKPFREDATMVCLAEFDFGSGMFNMGDPYIQKAACMGHPLALMPAEIKDPKASFMFWAGDRLLRQTHVLAALPLMMLEQKLGDKLDDQHLELMRWLTREMLNKMNIRGWEALFGTFG